MLGTSIVLIYSLFGGFRGVVLTDIIQFVLLLFSALVVFVVAFSKSGGWAAIAQSAEVHNKTQYMSIGAGASKYFTYLPTEEELKRELCLDDYRKLPGDLG